MEVFDTIDALRRARRTMPGTVGFVPTMGFLHDGHLELMRRARQLTDHLVVSIFVNPTQFEPGSDLDAYPRDPEGDRKKCEDVGCELLFMPTPAMMYPPGHSTFVEVTGLDETLCGPSRPGHFRGVTTVVTKLFHIVQPDVAVFGEKDFQQLAIIRQMVRDLDFPLEIVGVPTVREADGLARSSRNKYLDAADRVRARCLSRALGAAWRAYRGGERSGAALEAVARQVLLEDVSSEAIDYIECVHPDYLWRYADARDRIPDADGAVLALAVQVGPARLIDNLRMDAPTPFSMRMS